MQVTEAISLLREVNEYHEFMRNENYGSVFCRMDFSNTESNAMVWNLSIIVTNHGETEEILKTKGTDFELTCKRLRRKLINFMDEDEDYLEYLKEIKEELRYAV